MPGEPIDCATHGRSFTTFTCAHVATGSGLGFVFDGKSSEPWPDAMCRACAAEPPWTDEIALERIRVLCSRCWEDSFERNTDVLPIDDEAAWLHQAMHDAAPRQDRWKAAYRILSHARYDYVFDGGNASLDFGDGERVQVRGDAHVIGSWSGGTWLWGWANDHWEPRVTDRIVAVKRFGERQGVRALSRSGYRADEDLAWELASAVLAVLPDIEAIYRSPSEHASLFLAVERTRWVT